MINKISFLCGLDIQNEMSILISGGIINRKKKRFRETGLPNTGPQQQLVPSDELILGKPGYRNRINRTGYDPIDTIAECGYMFGIFLQNLFKVKLRATNTLYLAIIGIAGIYFLGPIILVVGNCGSYNMLCYVVFLVLFSPYLSIGSMLIINFIHNLTNPKLYSANSSD